MGSLRLGPLPDSSAQSCLRRYQAVPPHIRINRGQPRGKRFGGHGVSTVSGAISVSAQASRRIRAVSTTSVGQPGKSWKSTAVATFATVCRKAVPNGSGSNSTARGRRRKSASAVVVLPTPKGPLSQIITAT
jgi:hypothetical protein